MTTIELREPSINCNQAYLREHAPFNIENDTIILSESFFDLIENSWFHKKLHNIFDEIIITDNITLSNNVTHHQYIKVCNAYLDWYSADKWFHVLTDCNYVPLDKQEIIEILKGEYDQQLLDKINIKSTSFVKFKCKSTKHEYPPIAVYTAKEALDHLLQSQQLRNLLTTCEDEGIMIRKWYDNINVFNEFRAFVIQDSVVGLCQQYLGHNPIITMILNNYGDKLIPAIQQLWNDIAEKTEYRCGSTLDVWFTFNDEEITCNLIEINTSGLWTAAGSGLFTWKELLDLYNNKETKILYY